ncbi:hypothetical protein DVH24_026136 [Malus domestica]|uniref:Uncharacterized protein n=1 Tax=Malus domestica TaxID=3750 RepID=A0A498KF82_MALDO|nr:hypothetical protein DVH24_026136 [Malus domestica]
MSDISDRNILSLSCLSIPLHYILLYEINISKVPQQTRGSPCSNAVLFSNCSMKEFCAVSIATEANSEHPIAKSVVEHVKRLLKTFDQLNM